MNVWVWALNTGGVECERDCRRVWAGASRSRKLKWPSQEAPCNAATVGFSQCKLQDVGVAGKIKHPN